MKKHCSASQQRRSDSPVVGITTRASFRDSAVMREKPQELLVGLQEKTLALSGNLGRIGTADTNHRVRHSTSSLRSGSDRHGTCPAHPDIGIDDRRLEAMGEESNRARADGP
jgi:hypothetical protein